MLIPIRGDIAKSPDDTLAAYYIRWNGTWVGAYIAPRFPQTNEERNDFARIAHEEWAMQVDAINWATVMAHTRIDWSAVISH